MIRITLLIMTSLLLFGCGGSGSSSSKEPVITEQQRAEWRKITTIEIPVDDLVFDGLTAGPTTGTAVILLHGFPTTAYQFKSTIQALAERGYYVIAPNQRGFSEGARPLDSDDYHISLRVEDITDIADQLGIYRFHLVGHDSGAWVSWIVSSRHPDRVITLTAISVPHPYAFGVALLDKSSGQEEISSYGQDFASPGFEETFVTNDHAYMRELYEDIPAEDVEVYIEKMGSVEAIDAALNYYRVRGWEWTTLQVEDPITVPTLQVWGDQDLYMGIVAMEGSKNFVSAEYEFVIFQGVTHWVTETASERLNILLLEHLDERY